MKWSYKTVHFELKREGLLGGSFLDENEIEEQLNDFGRSGWELTSVIEVQDGIIAFFKQPLDLEFPTRTSAPVADDSERTQIIEEPYEADELFEIEDAYFEASETAAEPEFYVDDATVSEESRFEDEQSDDRLVTADEESSFVDETMESYDDQESEEEQDEHPDHRGIGAIRIE